jgi:circadian clock protein KaiC
MTNVKTEIQGFDRLVGGGFPQGKNILLSGTPGTGKTIFALQYLCNGALKFNEKGLYVTFEENAASLRRQAEMFGWNLENLEKKGKVTILDISAREITEKTAAEIIKRVQKDKYNRLVIDSLSALSINTPNMFGKITDLTDISIKRFMYHFITDLARSGATSLLISQTAERKLSSDGVSDFICDGIIHIKYESLGGEFSRSLTVRKMRQVKNDDDIHPLEIGKNGIVIHDLR